MKLNQNIKRNIGIDLLRGASTLYIVGFWHLLNYTTNTYDYSNNVTNRLTAIMLGNFVLISGYFIGLKKVNLSKQSLTDYYKKRFLRIYPLYFLSLFIFTIFNLSNLSTSLKAALLISMFMEPAPRTLWFITMLMQFYLISPFIVVACQKLKATRLIIYSSFLFIVLMEYEYITGLLDVRFVVYFPVYVLGVYMANNSIKIPNNIIFLLLILSFISSYINTSFELLENIIRIPLIMIGSYYFLKTFRKLDISSKIICDIIILISYSSYCMYLFHRPIYSALKIIFFPETNFFQVFYLVCFCLPCIIVFSYIFQKINDRTVENLNFLQ